MSSAMLTVREVAELLGIRPHSVTALIRANELRGIDISLHPGGRPSYRIERAELDLFIQRRTQTPTPRRRRKRTAKNVKQFF